MSVYVKDRQRWRRTVAALGFTTWGILVLRINRWDVDFLIDLDTLLFTVSVVALVYVTTSSAGDNHDRD